MKGIVWNEGLEIRNDVEVRAPQAREVVVRIVHAGVCDSESATPYRRHRTGRSCPGS